MTTDDSLRVQFKRLTAAEALRALYIDFEGGRGKPPVLLGILRRGRKGTEPSVFQTVLDPVFEAAGPETRDLRKAVETAVLRAERGDRLVDREVVGRHLGTDDLDRRRHRDPHAARGADPEARRVHEDQVVEGEYGVRHEEGSLADSEHSLHVGIACWSTTELIDQHAMPRRGGPARSRGPQGPLYPPLMAWSSGVMPAV